MARKSQRNPCSQYTLMMMFCLVWFYGVSTVPGYLMSNLLYAYLLNIYDLVGFYGISTIVGYFTSNPPFTYILIISDLVWLGFIAYQLLSFNDKSSSYISIRYIWFVNILLIRFLNEPKLILIRTVKWFQVLLCITNNLIKYQSFVYTQLNYQTVLFQIIQFSKSNLFAHSLNVKHFYLTHR